MSTLVEDKVDVSDLSAHEFEIPCVNGYCDDAATWMVWLRHAPKAGEDGKCGPDSGGLCDKHKQAYENAVITALKGIPIHCMACNGLLVISGQVSDHMRATRL